MCSDEEMLHEEEASSAGEAASEDGKESHDVDKSGRGEGGYGEPAAPPAPAGKRDGTRAAAEQKRWTEIRCRPTFEGQSWAEMVPLLRQDSEP